MKANVPLEKEVLRQCLDWLRLMRVTAWRNNTGGAKLAGHGGAGQFVRFGVKGGSDIIGVLPGGRFLAVECKRIGKEPTDDQATFLDAVIEAGGFAVVAHDVQELIDAVSPLLGGR